MSQGRLTWRTRRGERRSSPLGETCATRILSSSASSRPICVIYPSHGLQDQWNPTTRIPNSSSSSVLLVTKTACAMDPRFPFASRHRERLLSDSRVPSVKKNRHHHHQMKFWLRGKHGLLQVEEHNANRQTDRQFPSLRQVFLRKTLLDFFPKTFSHFSLL